jgi:hypothetical protein
MPALCGLIDSQSASGHVELTLICFLSGCSHTVLLVTVTNHCALTPNHTTDIRIN